MSGELTPEQIALTEKLADNYVVAFNDICERLNDFAGRMIEWIQGLPPDVIEEYNLHVKAD